MPIINYDWDEDEDNIVEEYDDTGVTVAEYTTEPDQFGDVLSQYRDGQESFYHTDGQGSTLALADANGDVADTYAYSAFGEVTAQTGSTVNPFQYIGQKQYYRDAETGDYEVRWRPLDVAQGRWLAVDPLSQLNEWTPWKSNGLETNGMSIHYSYSRNSPLSYFDPSGGQHVSLSDRWSLKGWDFDIYPGDQGAARSWYRYTCQLTTLGYSVSCLEAKATCATCQVTPFACCAAKVSSLVCSLVTEPLLRAGGPVGPCLLGCMNLCMFALWFNRRIPSANNLLWTAAEAICANGADCTQPCCMASVAAEQNGATICAKWCGKKCDANADIWIQTPALRVMFGWDLCCKRR